MFCHCVFLVPSALQLLRLGMREPMCVLFVRLFYAYWIVSLSFSSLCEGLTATCNCGIPRTFILPRPICRIISRLYPILL